MSQQTVAARPARTIPAARPADRRLHLVSGAPATGSGRFVALCVLLLFGGLVTVLVLNTSMAKGSFELERLQNQSAALTDTQETLAHEVDALSAPAELARRATALGMVPSPSAAFLRLSDGAILGTPEAATAKEGFVIATGPATTTGTTKPTTTKATTKATTQPTTTKPTTTKPTTKPTTTGATTTKPTTTKAPRPGAPTPAH